MNEWEESIEAQHFHIKMVLYLSTMSILFVKDFICLFIIHLERKSMILGISLPMVQQYRAWNWKSCFLQDSGKLAVVSCMLWALREVGQEKIVLVSNYTTTLDMLAALCVRYDYPYLRLDGSTPTAKRQHLVDSFNNRHSKDCKSVHGS